VDRATRGRKRENGNATGQRPARDSAARAMRVGGGDRVAGRG